MCGIYEALGERSLALRSVLHAISSSTFTLSFVHSGEIGKTAHVLTTWWESDSSRCHHSRWYLSSSLTTLNPGRSRGTSAATDLRQQAVHYETTPLVPLLTPGCLQYVDSPQVFPQGVPGGWNSVICLYPHSHGDLQDGLSVALNDNSSPWFCAKSSIGKLRTRNPLFLF